MRRRLPNRRPSETVTEEWGGHVYDVTLGFDPATGRLREMFCSSGLPGGQMAALIEDCAIDLSHQLQSGWPAADLPARYGRDQHGRPTSLLGVLADLAARVDAEMAA